MMQILIGRLLTIRKLCENNLYCGKLNRSFFAAWAVALNATLPASLVSVV